MTEAERVRVAKRIVARAGQRRVVLVVAEEGLGPLIPGLRFANFIVVEVRPGTKHEQIKQDYLPHRILVARNPVAFTDDAVVYEYGIISLEALKSIGGEPSFENNETVKAISRAVTAFELLSRRACFLLQLRDDGQHVLVHMQ